MLLKIIKKQNHLNGERRRAFYKQFLRVQLRDEKIFAKKLKPLFDEQERLVLDNLEKIKSVKYFELYNKNVEEVLFNEAQQLEAFVEFEKPILQDIIERSAKRIEELGIPIDHDIFQERVNNYIRERSLVFATEVNNTTREALRKTLKNGIDEGESIFQLQERVGDVYNKARGYRAEAIARTEVGSAMNYGQYESYENSRAVEGLEWVAVIDGRVRAEHLAADGQQIKLGQKFIVGGESLQYPQDPWGSAENTINCRCTTIPIL